MILSKQLFFCIPKSEKNRLIPFVGKVREAAINNYRLPKKIYTNWS